MTTYSQTLKDTIDAQATQKGVNDKLNELLTGTRTLTMSKDGVVFYSATMTGLIKMERDSIVDYGQVVAVSISNGANLSSGTNRLRIAGNGHYLEQTLGLTSASDFVLPASPAAGAHIAFTKGVRTKLPPKPNGIGPALPTIGADAPTRFELYSVVNGVESLVDFLEFDTPDNSITFADAEIAGQMGEVLVTKSSKTIIFDKFRFGAKRYTASASNSIDGQTTLYRVLVGAQPYNQGWDSYPAERNFNSATVYMHPPAFRGKLKNAAGTVIHVWQGRDGTAINDPSWTQNWDAGQVVRPLWHCAAMLPYFNVRARISDLKNKFFSGIEADFVRPSLAKRIHSCNGTEPYLDGYSNLDGYNHLFAMNQWPSRPTDYFAASAQQDQPLDPYMQAMGSNSGHSFNECINGWDYEPGSKSGLEYQTGPGGVRFDRSVIPSLYAMFATNPTGSRLKGNVPWRRMFDAHADAQFNKPMFLFRDVQNFTGIPDNEILGPTGINLWNDRNSYYGGTGGKGPDYTLDKKGVTAGNSTGSQHRNVKGQLHWNGYLPDYLHAYSQPGWACLLVNEPLYAIAAKHNFNALSLAQLDEQTDPANDWRYWSNRQYAWRLANRTMAWKLASGAEAGHERQRLQNQMRIGLESIYENYYVKCYERPIADIHYAIIKNLGVMGTKVTEYAWRQTQGSLSFYLADTLVLMKQTGMFSVMKKTNYKCERALWFLIRTMDQSSIDYLLDWPATWEDKYGSGSHEIAYVPEGQILTVADVPANWADFKTKVYDKYVLPAQQGVADWVTEPDGSLKDRFAGMHLRGQWVLNRTVYFPEYVYPRMAEGLTKVMAYHNKVRDFAATKPIAERAYFDFTFLHPSQGKRLPPSELGAE